MIRIHLRRNRKSGISALRSTLVAVLAVAGLGVGVLYWVDQRVPLQRFWHDTLAALGSTVKREPAPVVDSPSREPLSEPLPEAIPPAAVRAIRQPADSLRRPAPEQTPRTAVAPTPVHDRTAAETLATAASSAAPGAAVPVPTVKRTPRAGTWSTAACQWALRVSSGLPAGVRLSALTCKSDGEYSLEGMSASHRPVEAFLETLQRFPSHVDLSWWRSGGQTPGDFQPLHFAFHGEFSNLQGAPLRPVTGTQVATLWRRIGTWTTGAHLRDVSLGGPIIVDAASGMRHLRRKLWATGSYAQVRAFLRRLERVRDAVTLAEVVIVPVHAGDERGELARLYCVLEVLAQP